MRALARFVYGLLVLLLATAAAVVVGTLGVLPFVVLPRGQRERYTLRAAEVWARAVLCLLVVRVEVRGRAPDGGGFLFVANHRSWLDPLLIVAHTRSQGIAKREIAWLPVIGLYGYLSGAVFFDRRSPRKRRRAREEVMRLLRLGHRLHLFPEGTRSRDGELRERVFLTLPRDCHAAGVPVVPVAVHGTERALPPGVWGAVPGRRCVLVIGQPVRPEDHPDADAFATACWEAVRRQVGALRVEEGEVTPDDPRAG